MALPSCPITGQTWRAVDVAAIQPIIQAFGRRANLAELGVDRAALAGRFGVGKKQVKLADTATVLRLIGYPFGGVPPFGHVTRVPVLLDVAV